MKTHQKSTRLGQAFTLVEVMVVVAIVVILMTVVFGGFSYVQLLQSESRAKNTVNRMSMHLQEYYAAYGSYPDPGKDPETSSNALYMALFGDYDNNGTPDEGAIIFYEDLDPQQSAGQKGRKFVENRGGVYVILDPWGKPYRYRLGFNHGGDGEDPDFDIWSLGPDSRNETIDDITNGFVVRPTQPATPSPVPAR